MTAVAERMGLRGQQAREPVVARERMAPVLAERLALLDVHLTASGASPGRLGFQRIVDPVAVAEPIALAFVTGEHLLLAIEDLGDVDDQGRLGGSAVAVSASDRVDLIKVREPRQGRGRLPEPARIVRERGGEEAIQDESAGGLVVAEIVRERGTQHDLGAGPSDRLDDPAPRTVVVEDRQVAEFQAEVVGPDGVGGGTRLFAADPGDFLGLQLGRAAIAGGHRGDRDRASEPTEQRERAGAERLEVVGVGVDRKDSGGLGRGTRFSRWAGHGRFPKAGVILRGSATARPRSDPPIIPDPTTMRHILADRRQPSPSGPRPFLALVLVGLAVAGCDPSTSPESTSATEVVVTRGVYRPKSEGTAVELAHHIVELEDQFTQVNEAGPVQARAAMRAYTDAVAETARAILGKEGLDRSMVKPAATSWLASLRRRLDADPTRANLTRFLDAADELRELYPKSETATTAAFRKYDTISFAPPDAMPDEIERFTLRIKAVLELGQAEPKYPEALGILSENAYMAEFYGRPDLTRQLYRIMLENYPGTREAEIAEQNLERLALVGQVIEDIRGPAPDGGTNSLEALRGKVVLVDFWATWCTPCIQEIPEMKELRDQLGPDGFEILGVSVDRERARVVEYFENWPPLWPQIAPILNSLDPEKLAREAMNGGGIPAIPGETTEERSPDDPVNPFEPFPVELRFGIEKIPLKLLIDRDGRVIATGRNLDSILPAIAFLFPGRGVAPLSKVEEYAPFLPPDLVEAATPEVPQVPEFPPPGMNLGPDPTPTSTPDDPTLPTPGPESSTLDRPENPGTP